MDFDSLRPWLRMLVSGLVTVIVVYSLVRVGKQPAIRKGNLRLLSYGLGFRIVAMVSMPGACFVLYAAMHARSGQLIFALIMATAFAAIAVFLAYQTFFVSLAYDDENIYYWSILVGRQIVPWEQVENILYSPIAQSYYLRTKNVRRIWCSNMLRGYEELGEFLDKKAGG
jgi:hypothetical protein